MSVMTAEQFAFESEDDLRRIRHLAKAILALAEEEQNDTEYCEEIATFAQMIIETIDELQKQRGAAAEQGEPIDTR